MAATVVRGGVDGLVVMLLLAFDVVLLGSTCGCGHLLPQLTTGVIQLQQPQCSQQQQEAAACSGM